MPERLARITALALVFLLIVAFLLLIALFGVLNAPPPPPTPTVPPTLPSASPTSVPPTITLAPPTPTDAPTLVPSPSPTAGCPSPATPEPLWVNPVVSPTNLLSQKISVTLGRGREIVITSQAGSFTRQGEFSTAQPVEIEISLVPNAANNLLVSGRVEYFPGCFYTLQTRVDRVGNPLTIVQTGGSSPLPPTLIPTPPPPGTVYLKPFSQVFALNQDTPAQNDKLWLYEADPGAPFQIVAQQGAFTHVLSEGGTLNFWTLNDNLTTVPAPYPVFDTTVAGRRVEFVSDKIFACEGRYPRGLILGVCAELTGVTEGEVIERARVESSVLYLVRIDNKLYWVSSNVLKQEPQ
jgi:hypothetical protein